jgi:hypothetical protein
VRLRLDQTDAASLAAALQTEPAHADQVPLIFPIRWLALERIRATLAALADPGLLVHETQSFDYARALRAGEEYALDVTITADATDPSRITLHGTAADAGGKIVATLEAGLRVLPRNAAP